MIFLDGDDYFLPIVGVNIFLEWGRNDFSPGNPLIYPFRSRAYTFGMRKAFTFSSTLNGVLLFEMTTMDATPDSMIPGGWPMTFYAHHIITQGHTNRGQWLGAGIGTGGNSQYISFTLIYPRGAGSIFIQRRNPDLDHFWFQIQNAPGAAQNTFLDIGLSQLFWVTRNLSVSGDLVFRREDFFPGKDGFHSRSNMHFSAMIRYLF